MEDGIKSLNCMKFFSFSVKISTEGRTLLPHTYVCILIHGVHIYAGVLFMKIDDTDSSI